MDMAKNATKINTPADFVRAYEYLIENSDYKKAVNVGKRKIAIEIPIKEIFGESFRSRIYGRSRVGGAKNSKRYAIDTEFPDNTEMLAIFKKSPSGDYYLYTMYPVIPK
jgi:hypothetical protein